MDLLWKGWGQGILYILESKARQVSLINVKVVGTSTPVLSYGMNNPWRDGVSLRLLYYPQLEGQGYPSKQDSHRPVALEKAQEKKYQAWPEAVSYTSSTELREACWASTFRSQREPDG